jgi:hypothetical protein
MKSITNRLFLFAATALFLGTTAYGQTPMKADVPFAFRIPGGIVAAGNYVVNLDTLGGSKVLRLYNEDTHKSAVAIPYAAGGGPQDNNSPRLVFLCSEAGCDLSEVWTPNGGYAVQKGRAHAGEYLASIPLTIQRGN